MSSPPSRSSSTASPARTAACPVRILWVTRRFWPHGPGRHARAATSLLMAEAFSGMGMSVEAVTPRYGTHWSHEFQHGAIRVHRIVAAPKGEWSMLRHVRYLSNWLTEQATGFDWIVCDGINEDVRSVAAAIAQSRSGKGGRSEVVPNHTRRTRGAVLCDGWGGDGDDVWLRQSPGGKRCLSAISELDLVVSRHAAMDRALVAGGVSRERIRRIPIGFARPARVSLDQRLASRRSLASINTDLRVGPSDRVLLWCGHMAGRPNYESNVGSIVGSARLLCARYPQLKIWMLGDGELHDWVHTELKAEGVRDVVAIPGEFPDMTDVWNSVDAVVVNDEEQVRYTLPMAIAHALPTVLADHAGIRGWMKDKFSPEVVDSFTWYDARKPASFRKSFRSVWDDLPVAIDHAWEVALDASRRFSIADELHQWASVLTSDPNAAAP